jgi:cob(I)alamin adenosyltransferase
MEEARRILLFTGDGKGKTTAALGMALRAAGHGMRTLVIQFIKADPSTGELAACKRLPGIEIVQAGRGFVPDRASPSFEEHCRAAREGLALAEKALENKGCDLLILDEICLAVSRGLLEEKDVLAVLEKGDPALDVVLTGRNATAGLMALADTVTEMRMVKHGLAKGFTARRGVEF